ncbi:zinc finger MYM-type protein 6-like [Aphis craccivora]|uniref:Zinc finger MYM-type protein 6-like n=1 Tax=Aphis craccivora TaxID=307492 RepID=A0A6G0VTF7_APHCR|nr:zinc finger MYM-type protein 6-like [Aphis craccivora]
MNNAEKDVFRTIPRKIGTIHLILLEVSGLDINNFIGSSTDGASNMRGEYNGFSAWLKKKST